MMKIKSKILIGVLGFAVLGVSNNAHAVSIAGVGVGTLSNPRVSSDIATAHSYSAKLGFGGGALVDIPLNNMFSLQFGGLYVTRKFEDNSSGTINTIQAHGIEIPVQFRWWFTPAVSLGVGGYYSIASGDLSFTDAAGNVTTETYDDYGVKKSDYGVMGSLAAAIPLGGMWAIYAEGQYLYGLANTLSDAQQTARPTSYFKFSDFNFLLGLRYGAGGKGR